MGGGITGKGPIGPGPTGSGRGLRKGSLTDTEFVLNIRGGNSPGWGEDRGSKKSDSKSYDTTFVIMWGGGTRGQERGKGSSGPEVPQKDWSKRDRNLKG